MAPMSQVLTMQEGDPLLIFRVSSCEGDSQHMCCSADDTAAFVQPAARHCQPKLVREALSMTNLDESSSIRCIAHQAVDEVLAIIKMHFTNPEQRFPDV